MDGLSMKLLDLFCGAGGASMGYHRAGFDVIGVDIAPQPNYPFEFVQADALRLLRAFEVASRWELATFTTADVIHASPPCQLYSTTAALHDAEHPDLVAPVRDLLDAIGKPYVIENVVGAPLRNAVRLCGSSFGLPVWRHRLFEVKPMIGFVPPCAHHLAPEPLDVTGTGSRRLEDRTDGGGGNSRKPRSLGEARRALGIDWMTRRELAQAIPPAYTEWIGTQLLQQLEVTA
jgi:DNA (cytosine-5)-methyltransferase 1